MEPRTHGSHLLQLYCVNRSDYSGEIMNLVTEKIVRKWAHKNYFSSDPHKYRLLAIACSSVRDFTLIEAVNFIKNAEMRLGNVMSAERKPLIYMEG